MVKGIFLSILLSLLTGVLKSQNYEVSIGNAELVNQNTFEFDIQIKSTSGTVELTSYQCAFTFYSKITNGGSLSFSYISGTSEINNLPNMGVGINNTDGESKLTFASMPGNDIIDTVKKRIGRFKLENTTAFSPNLIKIINPAWNFSGLVSTILTGNGFTNITNPSNHISTVDGLNKLTVSSAFASGTANPNNHPGKTIDGLGYFDNDPESYWRAQPTPQWITFDLGTVKPVSLTRFSFRGFNTGRIFVYSVYLSPDSTTWTEVVSNDTSDLIEYTENIFDTYFAQYVKLLVISNNQNNNAAMWEAEIWDGDEGTVPVELSSFTGFVENNKVTLSWITNSEQNNMGFEVERKTLSFGEPWERIGFVEGSGTTTDTRAYSFIDENLEAGHYLYRLKQIDFNGSHYYSDVVEFEILLSVNSFQLYQNYPNPFNPETNITFSIPTDGKVKLEVYNVIGEKVAELINGNLSSGNHKVSFNGEKLSSGIYVYRLEVENQFTDLRKMILIK